MREEIIKLLKKEGKLSSETIDEITQVDIHDFSNLSDYDKEALVLWDKYLIYAVILEENTKILDEMKEYKSKIKTTI